MSNLDCTLEGKRILMVFAHCDDELVCGWPILQNPKIAKSLIIATSDRFNSKRIWCGHRQYVTQDLSKMLGIKFRALNYDSGLIHLNNRDGSLLEAERAILSAVHDFEFDYIFTHNPHGEYGHLDHVFLSNLLFRSIKSPLLITDITMESDWTEIKPTTDRYSRTYYHTQVSTVNLNSDFYRKVVNYYKSRKVWTWSQEPAPSANIFLI
jgi:LmbE family N-acetylglucosaminyl deacetylase